MSDRLPVIVITTFKEGQTIVERMRKSNESNNRIARYLKNRGFSNDTIATLMNISESTIRTLIK